MALRPQRHREMLSRPRNAQCLRALMAVTKRVSSFCSLIILSVFSGRREPIQTPALCCPGIGKMLCYHSKGCTRKQEACVLKWRNAQRVGGLVCFPFLFFFFFFLFFPHRATPLEKTQFSSLASADTHISFPQLKEESGKLCAPFREPVKGLQLMAGT